MPSVASRRSDLLHITMALLGQPIWPNSTRMLIRQLSQGLILPIGTPLSGCLLIGSGFELHA
jgi:hypothetical protein